MIAHPEDVICFILVFKLSAFTILFKKPIRRGLNPQEYAQRPDNCLANIALKPWPGDYISHHGTIIWNTSQF